MSYLLQKNAGEIELLIDEFHGGITNAVRTKDWKQSRFSAQLDILSEKHKASLNPAMTGDTFDTGLTAANTRLCQYVVANSKQYALGVVSGTTRPNMFERGNPTAVWAQSTFTGTNNGTARNESLFVAYKDSAGNLTIWGARDGTQLWSWRVDTGAFTQSAQALTYTNIAQGFVHPRNEILYIPYDNFIASNNAGTWSTTAFTLAKYLIASSICGYGNNLAIAGKPLYAGDRSILYVWDQDSTLPIEKIEWGYESLELIEEIDGYIIGVSTISNAQNTLYNPKLIFKYWTQGMVGPKKFLELPLSSLTINFAGKQKQNNRMYFMMSCSINDVFGTSTQRDGIWSIGRMEDGLFALSLDRLINNDTAITSPVPKGFTLYGDWMHAAFTDNATYVANRTPTSTPYASVTGVYELPLLNFGDSDISKQIKYVTLMFEPLPASSTIVCDYKVDAETSYTQIFSYNTLNGISNGVVRVSSAAFPQFKEIQLRIKITGSASRVALTGIKVKAWIIDKTPS